jgi:hypothetical protein
VHLEEHAQKLGQQHDELIGAQARLDARRPRLSAREPLQERIPRQHVARAAHAAQQLADPRQAAGRQRDGNLTPEQVKFARGITPPATTAALINDILDLSKIEARKIEPRRQRRHRRARARLSRTFEPMAATSRSCSA